MFRKEQPEVLVAGAGPVGMFLALRLVEAGIRVELVDEAWNRTARSYALALHPASLALLHDAGFADDLLEAGHRIDAVAVYDRRRRRAELSFGEVGGEFPFALVLPQSAFERTLERHLTKAGVRVSWNHRVARLEPGDDRVKVRIERLAKDSTGYGVATTEWVVDKEVTATPAFVVGTDGHRSSVRRELGAEFPLHGEPQLFAVFEFAADDDPWREVRLVFDEDTDNVLWPLGDGRFRASFQIAEAPAGTTPRRKDRLAVQIGDSAFPLLGERELEDLLEERAPWFDAELGDIAWSVAVRFERRLAEPFGHGRVWLAGDAGHLAGPLGVHSMNVGLHEAADLAARLAGVLRRGEALAGLAAYDAERRREWRQLLVLDGKPATAVKADRWIAARADRLLRALPASGAELRNLLAQAGLAAAV
jgi:2-polyprenyl-6-methoxyphenol hydroxylase-like FAD-dependent oxidoreductase